MVSVSPPQSPRSRHGRYWYCKALLILVGCLAVLKMVKNGSNSAFLLEEEQSMTAPSSFSGISLRSLRQDYGEHCRFYLAESAIPHGGLGVFTSVGILPQQKVGMDDLCIMIEHLPSHSVTHLRTHTWGSANVFGQFEAHHKGSAKAACEGLGTLYNAAPAKLATTIKVPPQVHDNGGLSRAKNAGAGAISHYYGMTGMAQDLIPAGSELTVWYGDWNFKEGQVYKKPKRNVEWVRENGMCVDNIEVQRATDPEMGRGAFATRFLKKGTLVAPAPLEITKSRNVFDYDEETEVEPLFVNYNFYAGDMLLYPYGAGVNLINHSSEKTNVGLQWSNSKFHHAEWLMLSKKELWKQSSPGGLILEVIALRDIQPGEELFMDYGKSWEEAWNKHVREWKPVEGASEYVYPAEMDETAPLKTVEEQKSDPYPANLMTVCHTPDDEREENNIVEWHDTGREFPFEMVVCHILERKEDEHGDLVYDVMLDWEGYEYDESVPQGKRYMDLNVPRKAIRFVDKPNTSDQHLMNGFRHPIELPKHLVPPQWNAEDSNSK